MSGFSWGFVGRITVVCVMVASLVSAAFAAGMWSAGERSGVVERHGKFGTGVITLDMGELPNSDCWYEVDQRDVDGLPGGDKSIQVEPLCP